MQNFSPRALKLKKPFELADSWRDKVENFDTKYYFLYTMRHKGHEICFYILVTIFLIRSWMIQKIDFSY